jgi:hypothetical protein
MTPDPFLVDAGRRHRSQPAGWRLRGQVDTEQRYLHPEPSHAATRHRALAPLTPRRPAFFAVRFALSEVETSRLKRLLLEVRASDAEASGTYLTEDDRLSEAFDILQSRTVSPGRRWRAPNENDFAAQCPARLCPCQRFACHLTMTNA